MFKYYHKVANIAIKIYHQSNSLSRPPDTMLRNIAKFNIFPALKYSIETIIILLLFNKFI